MFWNLQAIIASSLVTIGLCVPATASAAVQVVGPSWQSRGSQEELVAQLLSATNWQRRADAARALGLIGDAAVVEALTTAAVNDPDARVRRAASDALMQIRQNAAAQRWPSLPSADPPVEMVRSWYQRFLHREPDPGGLQAYVTALRRGTPPADLLAGMLASKEYYRRHRNDPAEFIVGLYNDVLGRTPAWSEVNIWLENLTRFRGDRQRLASAFLASAQPELQMRGY